MSAPAENGLSSARAGAIAVVLIAVLFLSLNVIAERALTGARLDFTENRVYSLSQGARTLLKDIEEPIDLTLYYSRETAREYAPVQAHSVRVRDMLETFEALSGGKLRVRQVEPAPFSEEEDEANAAGITAVPTQLGEAVYFGVVGENSVDGREIIPFLAPERDAFLEYDLIRMIDRLNRPTLPKVGLLTTLPLAGGAGGPQAALAGGGGPLQIYTLLTEAYDIVTLSADLSADDLLEIETLIIAQPPAMSDAAVYAIDQFVLRGGRAMVFLDPVAQLASSGGFPGGPPPIEGDPDALRPLLTAWGVDFAADRAVLDMERALAVGVMEDGRQVARPYPLWLDLLPQDFDAADPATADLARTIRMGGAGFFIGREDAAATFTPLIQTSELSMAVDAARVAFDPQPLDLLRMFAPSSDRYALAARITGGAPSAFGDAPPQDAPTEDGGGAEHIAEIASGLNVILVADADLLDDRFYITDNGLFVSVTADNGSFVLNAVDNLLGSDNLRALRARAPANRPMTAIEDLRRAADERMLEEEERLEAELASTEARLEELERQGKLSDSVFAAPTAEEQTEIARFQAEVLRIRGDLRRVQQDLSKDIDALKGRLIFFNVWAAPLAFGLIAVGFALRRRARTAAKTDKGATA
ncbi:MAG: Gldg family protein [Pseudomonadota bacterium]